MLWEISYALSFFNFSITFSLVGGPQNNGSVDFLGFCSGQQFIFLPILIRECFIHYNDTKMIAFGWKLLILWVISCGPIFCNLQFDELSCLKTLEIGQMPKTTVHKKLLIKSKIPKNMWWFWCHDDGKMLFYPIQWKI